MVGRSRNRFRRTLIITGKQQGRRRYLIKVQNRSVWLTATMFTALCQLIVARIRTRTGCIPVSRMTIMRLRKTIDCGVKRKGLGKMIIHTGGSSEYCLGLPLAHVAVDPSFRQVLVPGLITEQERKAILSLAVGRDATVRIVTRS